MSIIVSSEDRDTNEVHTHEYEVSFFEDACDEHQLRYPNDYCLNADFDHCAMGYPTPTVYDEAYA